MRQLHEQGPTRVLQIGDNHSRCRGLRGVNMSAGRDPARWIAFLVLPAAACDDGRMPDPPLHDKDVEARRPPTGFVPSL